MTERKKGDKRISVIDELKERVRRKQIIREEGGW